MVRAAPVFTGYELHERCERDWWSWCARHRRCRYEREVGHGYERHGRVYEPWKRRDASTPSTPFGYGSYVQRSPSTTTVHDGAYISYSQPWELDVNRLSAIGHASHISPTGLWKPPGRGLAVAWAWGPRRDLDELHASVDDTGWAPEWCLTASDGSYRLRSCRPFRAFRPKTRLKPSRSRGLRLWARVRDNSPPLFPCTFFPSPIPPALSSVINY